MNIVASNHNRLLAGNGGSSPVEYSAGPNINITDRVISGKYWDDEIASAAADASAAAVDSAFDKSTTWVEEQNYLTAHQDVSNLPYVQNSALEFNGALISGISGSGFYAVSADLANSASESERAISATVSQEAIHAESADFANTADSAHVADYAISAEKLVNGYRGIAPIVVDNDEMIISAQSAKLGVQGPLYFVEDTSASTVIGIYDSAFPTFEGTEDGKISAINGSALNAASVTEYSAGNNIDITDYVISVTGSVPSADRADYAVSATSAHFSHSAIEANSANYATESNHTHSADSATYDSLGRKIVDTYLTAHQELPDWTPTIQNASGNAYNSAVNWVVDQHYLTSHQDVSNLPYVQNTALESNGILISGISGSGFYATSADNAFEADHAYEADYVLSGWEYDDQDRISGYKGSAFAGQGGQGVEYEGIAPIVVNNIEHKISAQSARLGVQDPLYFVEDSNTATVIGISGLPEVEGLMYESGLGTSENKITGYNGSAFAAGATYDVKASSNINVSTAGNTFTVSGKNWSTDIQNASSYAYNQATANATGKYIPYTHISTGDSGTTCYNVASGIRTTAASGWVEMYPRNKEHQNEAHLQVAQNYQNSSFWSEIDGADGGLFQMNWNSGNIDPNDHNGYDVNTTANMDIGNGWITYSAKNGPYWTIHSGKVNNWDSVTNTVSANSANWGGKNYISATNNEGTYTVVGENIELGLQATNLRAWSRYGMNGAYMVYGTGNNPTLDSAAEYRPYGMLLWSGSDSAKIDYPAIKMLQALSGIISQYSAHWVLN